MTNHVCSWCGHPRADHQSYEHVTDLPALTQERRHVCGGCTTCFHPAARAERMQRAERRLQERGRDDVVRADGPGTDRAEVRLAGDWFDGLTSAMADQYELPGRLLNQLRQTERLGALLARRVETIESRTGELERIAEALGQTTPIDDGRCIWCGTEQDGHLDRSEAEEDRWTDLLRAGRDHEKPSWHEVVCPWLAAWHNCQ